MYFIISPNGIEYKSSDSKQVAEFLANHNLDVPEEEIKKIDRKNAFDFITQAGWQISWEPSENLKGVVSLDLLF